MKNLFKILALNAFFIIVGLLFLEVIFGGWLKRDKIQQIGLLQNQTVSMNVSKLYDTDKPQSTAVYNEFGFRGPCPEPEKIEILTVGGSTTQELLISDGRTWQDHMANVLRSDPTWKNVCIANAGVAGQSTIGHILNFKLWFPLIQSLHPKIVIFYIGINDFRTSISDGINRSKNDALAATGSANRSFKQKLQFYFSSFHAVDPDQDLRCRTIVCEIHNFSALYRIFKTVKGAIFARKYNLSHGQNAVKEIKWTQTALIEDSTYSEIIAPGLENYAQNIRTLARLSREWGATPIFVNQRSFEYYTDPQTGLWGDASIYDFADKKFNGVDKYYFAEIIAKHTFDVCREVDGVCIDLFGELKFEQTDFYDSVHTSEPGSKLIGEFIASQLRDEPRLHKVIGQ